MEHEMKLWRESFLSVFEGRKTVEMRLFDEKRARIALGDTIVFRESGGTGEVRCSVVGLCRYPDFETLYRHHDPVSIGYAPGERASASDMLAYYSREDIERYGVLGICVQLLPEMEEIEIL